MNDFIGTNGIGTWGAPASGGGVLGASARPAAHRTEFGIQHYDQPVVVMVYDNEGAAMRTLTHQRKDLQRMGIPEAYWPQLMRRSVETVVGEWRPVRE